MMSLVLMSGDPSLIRGDLKPAGFFERGAGIHVGSRQGGGQEDCHGGDRGLLRPRVPRARADPRRAAARNDGVAGLRTGARRVRADAAGGDGARWPRQARRQHARPVGSRAVPGRHHRLRGIRSASWDSAERQWMFPNPNYHARVGPGVRWALRHLPCYGRWYRFLLFWPGCDRGWRSRGSTPTIRTNKEPSAN
jgi:hypothetical protein